MDRSSRRWWVSGGISAAVVAVAVAVPLSIHATTSSAGPVVGPAVPAVIPPTSVVATIHVPATTGTSATSSVDTLFLATLNENHIPYNSPTDVIALAHSICTVFGDGASYATVAAEMGAHDSVSADDIGYVIGASTAAYCPAFNLK